MDTVRAATAAAASRCVFTVFPPNFSVVRAIGALHPDDATLPIIQQ
jgi:hypothetical protein